MSLSNYHDHTYQKFALPNVQFPIETSSICHLLGKPLAAQPAVEEVERGLRLVHGRHVAGLVDAHEGEVARSLDLAIGLVGARKLEILELGLVEAFLT